MPYPFSHDDTAPRPLGRETSDTKFERNNRIIPIFAVIAALLAVGGAVSLSFF